MQKGVYMSLSPAPPSGTIRLYSADEDTADQDFVVFLYQFDRNRMHIVLH